MCARDARATPLDRILELAEHAGTWRSVGATECYALLDIVTEAAMQSLTQTDAKLRRLGEGMRMIQTANGLAEEEDYYLDEAPADWLELNRQWDHRFDQLRADLFRQIGEAGMANEVLLFPETFEARSQEGRSALFDIAEEDDDID